MRLIDADALEKEMCSGCEYNKNKYANCDDCAIANTPTIDAGRIPCSERLPKEYAQYLVCFEDGECHVYRLEDSDGARGMAEKEGIIAWMPLPKPYKAESEEEDERSDQP